MLLCALKILIFEEASRNIRCWGCESPFQDLLDLQSIKTHNNTKYGIKKNLLNFYLLFLRPLVIFLESAMVCCIVFVLLIFLEAAGF